jgi:hypothetical protein
MNNEKTEIEIGVKHDEVATFTISPIWQPTPLLRWKKRFSIVTMNHDKVLQQKWISNTGEEMWCDIKEED